MKTFKRTEALAEAVTKDPEGFAKWVEALRSGKYEQIRQAMTRVGKEESCGCCLHILQLAHGIDAKLSIDDSESSYYMPQQSQVQSLGGFPLFNFCANVYSDNPKRFERSAFSALNDDHKLTFGQIADIIEGKIVEIEL